MKRSLIPFPRSGNIGVPCCEVLSFNQLTEGRGKPMAVQFKVRLPPSFMNMILGGWAVIFGGALERERKVMNDR